MDAALPVQNLRVNGQQRPLAIDEPPLLSWDADPRQRFVDLRVADSTGAPIWQEEPRESRLPELRPPLRMESRAEYCWQVRVSSDGAEWTAWSDVARWETGQLKDEDWEASWIARPVPPGARNLLADGQDGVEWATDGWLSQQLTSAGPFVAVHADLIGDRLVDVAFSLELVDAAERVIASHNVDGPQHIWDRFFHFLELEQPAPAGSYELRLRPLRGRVGWHWASPPPATRGADDGVSPLPLNGPAGTDGVRRAGIRATAVETIPAANPVFRSHFELGGQAASARLSAVALGNGFILVNGIVVGTEMLEPAPTDYSRRVLYRRWDITSLLRPGQNLVEIHAGRGTFSARGANVWGWNLAPWHQEPMVRARLDWTLDSGERGLLTTGADWQVRAGDTLSDLLYCGEGSRSPQEPSPWEPARCVSGPAGTVRAATVPPMREMATSRPVSVTSIGAGRTLYDFGTMITGVPRMTIRGSAGSRVVVTSGENLSADRRIVTTNFLTAGESQVDTHVFEVADVKERWGPRFGYRGFRWVEVVTVGDAVVDDVLGVLIHTDVEPAGEFDADDAVLTWADQAFRRTFLNNLQGIPTDTPIFEKNGWTADAMLSTEALLHGLDLRATFGKWMQDHADAQGGDGIVPQIVPSPGFGRAADPAWSGSAVIMPWQLYWEYGDLVALEASATSIEQYCEALMSIAGDGIWPLRSWGDWLAPGHELPPEGAAPAATVMMASVLEHGARAMRELGRVSLADRYSAAAAETAAAFHGEFFDPASGAYAVDGTGYRQALNILPLAFGVVPEEYRRRVEQSLVRDIEQRTNGHLDTGALGSRFLLDVLSAAGRDDLALTVATRRTRPSWGAWMEGGETTLMESWDANARSRNHYFLGAALSWVYQRVGGLRAAAPGWRRIAVRPIDDPRITRGLLRHRTPYGQASIQWARTASHLEIELLVPGGAVAEFDSDDGTVELGEGLHRLQKSVRG